MASKRKSVKSKAKKLSEFHVKVASSAVHVFSVFAATAENANDLVASGEGTLYDVEEERNEILFDHTLPYFEGE